MGVGRGVRGMGKGCECGAGGEGRSGTTKQARGCAPYIDVRSATHGYGTRAAHSATPPFPTSPSQIHHTPQSTHLAHVESRRAASHAHAFPVVPPTAARATYDGRVRVLDRVALGKPGAVYDPSMVPSLTRRDRARDGGAARASCRWHRVCIVYVLMMKRRALLVLYTSVVGVVYSAAFG